MESSGLQRWPPRAAILPSLDYLQQATQNATHTQNAYLT